MEFAINTDCRKIINKFAQNGSLSFAAFCEQWKTIMFQHIYSAQSSTTEMLQTTTAVLYVAKQIFCRNDGDDVTPQRIGALYLLYAIYFKQPNRQSVKIDVTLSDWRKIRKFVDNLDDDIEEYDEARFIFWSLHEANAFRFCAHGFHLGLENLVDYDKVMKKCREDNVGSEEQNSSDTLEELMEFSKVGGMVPALTTLEDGYNEMKDLLINEQSKGSAMIDSQTLPASTIFKDIKEVFMNIKDIMKGCKRKAENDELKNTRRDLKSKGYKVTQTKRDGKIESSKSMPQKTSSKRIRESRAVHRMSGKTVFADQLPDETLQDLEGENDDDENDDGENDDDIVTDTTD